MADTARSTWTPRSSSTATRVYPLDEAVDARARRRPRVKFDATVEAHLRLGVDPRHADQMVRGTVVLPHGTGKVVRVAVFAQGEKAQEALRAGADEVGGRGPGQEDRGRLARVRRRDRDAGHDGPGRPPRPDPRPPRPHAEPQGRHGHVRHRARRPRGQGRPRRVQGRQGRDHPRPGRQGELRGGRSWSPTSRPSSTRSTAPSRAGAKGQYLRTLTIATHDGPRHPRRHPGRPRGRAA